MEIIPILCFQRKEEEKEPKNNEGEKIFEKNMTNTVSHDEHFPEIQFYGENILVFWRADKSYYQPETNFLEEYMIVDKKGNKVSSKASFLTHASMKMKDWEASGFNMYLDDLAYQSNFIQLEDGSLLAIRLMPEFLANYIEVVRIKK